jgi:phosphoglycerate-specific signal transduction histidine kinase
MEVIKIITDQGVVALHPRYDEVMAQGGTCQLLFGVNEVDRPSDKDYALPDKLIGMHETAAPALDFILVDQSMTIQQVCDEFDVEFKPERAEALIPVAIDLLHTEIGMGLSSPLHLAVLDQLTQVAG